MVAVAQPVEAGDQLLVTPGLTVGDGAGGESSIRDSPRDGKSKILTMGRGYAYREANWQIGRAAERANVQVKEFVPGDRWTAWKRSQTRIKANEEKKRLRTAGKKGGKAKKSR